MSPQFALMDGLRRTRRPSWLRRCWALVLLTLASGAAQAVIQISAASLERTGDLTRIVIESEAEIRFSLYAMSQTKQLVLELEGAQPSAALLGLGDMVAADHPYLQAIKVRPATPGGAGVRLEMGLKRDVEHRIVTLKPQGGLGYRLVLEIAPTAAAWRTPAPADDPSLVLLEVRLDNDVLADSITSYQIGREAFLPLGELARLLTLAIRVQPEQGTADGYVLSEERGFSLDVAQTRITLADQAQSFDPRLVRRQGDDIYVASSLLARWLPIDFEVNLSSLTLWVRPRERLPLQARLERERLGARVGARAGEEDPGYPRQDQPYRLLGVPFIDQTFGAGLKVGNGRRETSASYTAYLTGDLLGTESSFFVSSTKESPNPELRYTLARHDPDAGLLGPLQARSVMFGSGVTTPSVTHIANRSQTGKGTALTMSNRPITQPTSFDRHTLQGDLPPGWDVQLFFNDALVGFQSSRADGRYSFDDQPLAYGLNEFRLVFHGPLGQQRVERQSFLLQQSSTPAGAFYYTLSQLQDKEGQSRSVAQFEWGLSKYLTGTGGFVRLPRLDGSTADDGPLYSNLGLRAFWQTFILSSEFFRSPTGGQLNDTGLKTRLGSLAVSYNHLQFNDFSSELFLPSADPLRTRDKVRLDGAVPAGWLPRLPVTLEVQRDDFQSGIRQLAVTGRVAAYVRRTAVSNQLTWVDTGDGGITSSGALQLSRRVGDMGLSGQLGYLLKPEAKVDSVVLAADKRLGGAYLVNLGVIRSVGSGETLYIAGLNKSLGSYGLGVSMSQSTNGEFAIGLQLFIGMGFEPRQEQWRFSALPRADSGAASARVFLDDNGNGVLDAGEEPIENAALIVNGSRAPVRTDAAGVAWLDRLPIRQHVDIGVDTQTLEDPYWAPQRKGVRVLPRPGHVAELDFPVILTSEIDGTVYLADKSGRRGIGDVVIELLDGKRSVVMQARSSSDGYYIVPAVPQGRYYLRVSPQQLRQFDLVDPGERLVTVLPSGEFVNGVDFELRKIPTATPSGLPGENQHGKQ